MSLDINAAMDLMGAALGTISGLRVFDFPADQVSPPAALIDLDAVDYDAATQRNADRAQFKVYLVVGSVVDRSARDALHGYLNGAGSGTTSVKAALDAIGGHAVRVMRAEKTPITVAGVTYQAAAVFDVDYIA